MLHAWGPQPPRVWPVQNWATEVGGEHVQWAGVCVRSYTCASGKKIVLAEKVHSDRGIKTL